MRRQYGFISGFQMKLIMAALMVLDHLYYNLYPATLKWGHIAARVVAPVFVYLMTEGMIYTRSRKRYIGRMLGFGFVMMAGTTALHMAFGTYQDVREEASVFTIFIALGISAAIIAAIDNVKKGGRRRILWLPACFGLIMASSFFEGGTMIPMIAIIFYYLRRRTALMCFIYAAVFGGIYILYYFQTGVLSTQFYMIFAVIPILCYNGKRGPDNAFTKYFFYFFYPLHIWIIFLLEQAFR